MSVIGKVFNTNANQSTMTDFWFWYGENIRINAFDIIRVKRSTDSYAYAIIEELYQTSDAANVLTDYISNNFGDVNITSQNTDRLIMNYGRARLINSVSKFKKVIKGTEKVFFDGDDDFSPLGSNSIVEIIDDENCICKGDYSEITDAEEKEKKQKEDKVKEIQAALGMRSFKDITEKNTQKEVQSNSIKCGYIEMYKGTEIVDEKKNKIPKSFFVPAIIDSKFLIGPEGAHLNIAGVSGLASKTSYAMFTIKNIYEKCENTAFIIFNVKSADLMMIDTIADEDKRDDEDIYKMLDIEFKTIENVKYYLPYDKNVYLTYLNDEDFDKYVSEKNPKLKEFRFDYTKDKKVMEFFFKDNDSIPQETIRQYLYNPEDFGDGVKNCFSDVKSWKGVIDAINKNILKDIKAETNPNIFGVTKTSWTTFVRNYSTMLSKTGLFSGDDKDPNKVCHLKDEIDNLEAGNTMVIDMSKLDTDIQALVFADTLNQIYEKQSKRVDSGDDTKIVVFIDELNKYASAESKNDPILKTVLDITERGRSMGAVLIGAEQFRSGIHPRVLGNSATELFGRTKPLEAAGKDYSAFNDNYKQIIQSLKPGEYIFSNAAYTAPLKIKFPKPVYKQPKLEDEKK
jgi:hypothetical protein